MADDDDGYTIPGAFIPDLQATVDHYRQHGIKTLQPLLTSIPPQMQRAVPPVRAYLRQSLYLGNQALAEVCRWQPDAEAFIVEVMGINPVPESQFRLRFSQTNGEGDPLHLFTTQAIDVLSSAQNLIDKILAAGVGFLTENDLYVAGGNPWYNDQLVIEPIGLHPDILLPGAAGNSSSDTPASYVGQWFISIPQIFNGRLLIEAEETEDIYMRGASSITCRRTYDVPTNTFILVRDTMDLTIPGPAKAGCKIIAQHFFDTGFTASSIAYRDMTVDLEYDADLDSWDE